MLANITNTPQGDPQSLLPGFWGAEAIVVICSYPIDYPCWIGINNDFLKNKQKLFKRIIQLQEVTYLKYLQFL